MLQCGIMDGPALDPSQRAREPCALRQHSSGATARPARRHLVKIYQDHEDLVEALAQFVNEGISQGEPVLIIATAAHCDGLLSRLAALGTDAEGALERGEFVLLDAHETLPKVLTDDTPDPCKFEAALGSALARMRNGQRPRSMRVYGEMVDLLVHRGLPDAALQLEDHWNRIMLKQPMTLLCSYHIDVLDHRSSETLEWISACHAHALFPQDRERFDAAIEAAFHQVVGGPAPRLLPLVQATIHRNPHIGNAEKTIFWMRRNLPSRLPRLLHHAKQDLLAP